MTSFTPTGKGELALKKKNYQAHDAIIFWGLLQGLSTNQGKRLSFDHLNFIQIKLGVSKLLLNEN